MSALKQTILITRNIGEAAMKRVYNSSHNVIVWPEDSVAPRSWVLEKAKGATAICVMNGDPVNDELLDAAGPSLKIISTFSVGYDHVDISALKKRNVRLGHTPGVLDDAVADTTVMLLLMAMRRGGEAISVVRDGLWPQRPWAPFQNTGPALSSPSLTIGFLGFGRISQSTLSRILAFTAPPTSSHPPRCIYTTSRARENQNELDTEHTKKFGIQVEHVEKHVLAAESDVLIVLCNLNESTKGLVGEEFLKLMKKTSVLVNAARGGVVDSNALAKALETGQIYAAGLDVVDGEPNITPDHVLVKQPRCVIFPHIGSATFDARNAMARLCAENALAVMDGTAMPAELKL